jgi:hypothetical protein
VLLGADHNHKLLKVNGIAGAGLVIAAEVGSVRKASLRPYSGS